MIAKDTTVAVNFLVLDTDGFPATGKTSSISAVISINGTQATSISDTVVEKGNGWYYFTHNFGTAGNVFIEFSATNCIIEPWEDEVISMASAPSASDIATAVWSYEDDNNFYHPYRTIYGIESGNTIYQPFGPGHEQYLAESIWGLDPSIMLSSTSAARRLIDIQTNAARPGDAMTLTAVYNAAKTASQFNASTDTVTINSAQATTMVTATGFATPANITAAQTAIINAMPSTTGLATSSDISTAQTAIINAMPSTSGLATGSDVSSAQAAIIAAIPDISGLSTFDPTNDTVLIDSTQAAGMATATGFATPSDVAHVAAELEIYGDAHWYGDGITARDVWTYTGPRTLTASPTDISSLATKTDLTSAKTAIIAAMPDVSGLSTFDPTTDTVIIDATQTADFATSSDITTAQEAIISAVEGIDLSGLATSTDTAVLNAELQELIGGVMNWYVTANTLTVYSPSNTVIRTYSITRDPEGNITRIQPNN